MAVEILVNNEGELDCHACDETLKEERGHYKEGKRPWRIGRETFFRCPLVLITPISYEYIKAYSFYDKSILPNGIGWINESHKFTQAMQILDNEFKNWQAKLAEKKSK